MYALWNVFVPPNGSGVSFHCTRSLGFLFHSLQELLVFNLAPSFGTFAFTFAIGHGAVSTLWIEHLTVKQRIMLEIGI